MEQVKRSAVRADLRPVPLEKTEWPPVVVIPPTSSDVHLGRVIETRSGVFHIIPPDFTA